jgi:DNA-binding FadR family transcriptional regulator
VNKQLFTRSVKASSNVDTVIGTFKDLLIGRRLKPGDLIPSENELSESLSISRGSVREAMKILAAFGVIEIQQGHGTYIATSVNKKLLDPLLFSVLASAPDMEEVAELRVLTECGIVDLIISHASDDDLALLQRAYEAMAAQMQHGVTDQAELLSTDLAFHRVMGQITRNKLVGAVYGFVMELFAPTMKPGHGLESHRRILEAVKGRDLAGAIAAVREHVATWTSLNREAAAGVSRSVS